MMAPVALPLARALKLPVTPLVLLLELLGDRVKAPDFEKILEGLDWRAIFFYIALFALVGGRERMRILDALAQQLRPIFTQSYALGATLMYWITVPIVGIVEHDAYILAFLHTIKGVAYDGVTVTDEFPAEAILRIASQRKCDLIVTASHGRRGLAGVLLGSETQKVLTHAKVPVLVCR